MTTQIEKVNTYYQSTFWDYKLLWMGGTSGIHFGYFDNDTRGHRHSLLRMNEILARKASLTSSDYVLDAGCGYGGSALWLAQHIGCSVVGITPVPFQVQQGGHDIKKKGFSKKVQLVRGDYTRTPFPDNTFSVYWALESVVHADDRPAVLHEAFRVLRKGGRLIIAEYLLREDPPLSKDERVFLSPWLRGWAMPTLWTKSDYSNCLSEAGFRYISYDDITDNVVPSLMRLKRMCAVAIPIGKLLNTIGLLNTQRLENAKASYRQIQGLEKGLWRYQIITARK